MHIRCPHCRNPIELIDDGALDAVDCPSCGIQFSLVTSQDATKTYIPESSESLGHFTLDDRLGMGCFGTVWKARDTELDRTVAIKIPRKGQLDQEETEKFLREARAAAQLKHPNIVSVHEVGREGDTVYIVSDFVDGLTLTDWLTGQQPTPREAAELCAKLAEALHHAHEQGVIHRDLKPGNIMLDREHEPHIMDFGLAKREAGEITMTMDGQVLGTPAYMSPEQAKGEGHNVDRRADVYSLGVILFELLTGERPFRGNTRMLIHQLLTEESPSPRRLNSSVPRDLETICQKCLQKEPDRRYATCLELAEDLNRWREGEPIHARPVGRIEKTWLWCRRRPTIIGTISAAFFVLLAVTLILNKQRNAAEAKRLVEGLQTADTSQVDSIIGNLADYRTYARDDLNKMFTESPDNSIAKLHAALAMLPEDDSVLPFLKERLLTVSPIQFSHVRDLMHKHDSQLVGDYWQISRESIEDPARRFHAACALATYDPENDYWQDKGFQEFVSGFLVSVSPSELLPWRNALRPVKKHLAASLEAIYRDDTKGEQARSFATDLLAYYQKDDAEELFELLADADQKQFVTMFDQLTAHQQRAVALGNAELARTITEDAGEEQKESLAMRQANVAIMLLRMDTAEKAWPIFKHSPDPRVRSYVIHWLSSRGGAPETIIAHYEKETDVTIKRALLLCLGEFDETRLPQSRRRPLIESLLTVYRSDHDAGLHAASEWLLRKWQQGESITTIDKELQQSEKQLTAADNEKKQWYINTQGQTFAILDADEFQMGSPASEAERNQNERLHRRKIGRRIAISTKEVTKQQWRRFSESQPANVWQADQERLSLYIHTDDSPMLAMTWFEAAWYCNWLSEQEGIHEEQWCYETNDRNTFGPGMKAKDNFLELVGYRLPTEAEWEYACRAGTKTSRYYGQTETLLPEYAWYQENGKKHAWPVASLKPNDFGLFDVYGNAYEWCYDDFGSYPSGSPSAAPDTPKTDRVPDASRRLLRGGSFSYPEWDIRSARRNSDLPNSGYSSVGFRVARTYP